MASWLAAAAVAAMAMPAAAATVTAFATNLPQSLYGLASDSQALYYTGATGALRDYDHGPNTGVLGKVLLADGTASILYDKSNYATSSGHVAPMQLITDGAGNLSWADPDAGPGTGASFIRGTTGGAAPTQFFGICCGPGVLPGDGIGWAASGGHTYFSDATGGRAGADPSGSSATQIGPTRYAPDFSTAAFSQIAASNGKIFLADSGQILGADNNGVAVQVDQSAYVSPAVRWISVDGTSGFVDLSVGKIDHPHGIVAVGKFLYVTGTNKIWKVNATTGKTQLLASSKRFQDLRGITYVNGVFYVADSQTIFGPPVNGVATATSDGPGIIWKVVP
jgi:hypothetical protein